MSKFKIGDIITLIDDSRDLSIQQGIKGYYQIIGVTSDSYGIRSLKKNYTMSAEEMSEKIEMYKIDYYQLLKIMGKSKVEDLYPCHIGQYDNAKEFFEESYRLANKQELHKIRTLRVLHEPKIQKRG